MNTKILFFGSLTDLFGRERAIDLPVGGISVAELRRNLAANEAEAAALRPAGIKAAVDQQVVGGEAIVRPGQEIAFFSAVSGG